MFAWQLAKAQFTAKSAGGAIHFDAEPLQPLYREEEREMIPLCLDQGVGALRVHWRGGFSPEPGSVRARRARCAPHLTRLPTTCMRMPTSTLSMPYAVADERGLPPAQIALAWLLAKPGVSAPIMGATKLQHLEDAIAAEQVTLDEDEIKRLEAPYRPHSILGHS